jgi:hypothetical protein
MILEKQTNTIIEQEGETQDSIGMSLDLESAQVLMQMLSKNLYSDSIGSTIRECASNALDSHRRAGVDKPIIVSFKPNSEDNYEFSVEDFGIGLDADDVKNIISKYGKSTKRNSSTELGMMGLGFKAPLAYSSSFYFICRKDGIERKYMMYEGEDVNTIDLLYESPTTEGNGVKVIVPVKYFDKREFYEKISEQLAYFDSVYFDCGSNIDNDFVIYRSDLFQFSQLATDSNLHLCLDNVYYPIDFQKLGIDRISFPVAIRLGLTDGVFPTPNRESIRYTKEAKEVILNKITQIANFFVNKYNETVEEVSNIKDIFDYYSSGLRYIDLQGVKKDISVFQGFATITIVTPKMKGVEVLDLEKLYRNKHYIFSEYETRYRMESGRWRECKRSYDTDLNDTHLKERIFVFSEKIPGKKKEYLKELYARNTGYGNRIRIVKKVRDFKLGRIGLTDFKTYHNILSLKYVPKNKWRQAIQEFQSILKSLFDSFLNIDQLDIPQDWLDSKKKVTISIGQSGGTGGPRKVKLKGEIIGKQALNLERWVDGKNCKWVSTTYRLETMHREKSLMVYSGEKDVELMDKLFKIVDFHRCKSEIKFVQFSPRELGNMAKVNFHNWITFDQFMKGENKPFKRLVTAYLIEKLYDKNRDVFNKRQQLRSISEDLFNKLDTLDKYRHDNCEYANVTIYEAMLEVAEMNNAFDQEIYPIYKQVKALLEKLAFLQPLCDTLHSYVHDRDKPVVKAIADLFKYYRQRIDWKNYNIKLNEEVVNQPITEEEVEELA